MDYAICKEKIRQSIKCISVVLVLVFIISAIPQNIFILETRAEENPIMDFNLSTIDDFIFYGPAGKNTENVKIITSPEKKVIIDDTTATPSYGHILTKSNLEFKPIHGVYGYSKLEFTGFEGISGSNEVEFEILDACDYEPVEVKIIQGSGSIYKTGLTDVMEAYSETETRYVYLKEVDIFEHPSLCIHIKITEGDHSNSIAIKPFSLYAYDLTTSDWEDFTDSTSEKPFLYIGIGETKDWDNNDIPLQIKRDVKVYGTLNIDDINIDMVPDTNCRFLLGKESITSFENVKIACSNGNNYWIEMEENGGEPPDSHSNAQLSILNSFIGNLYWYEGEGGIQIRSDDVQICDSVIHDSTVALVFLSCDDGSNYPLIEDMKFVSIDQYQLYLENSDTHPDIRKTVIDPSKIYFGDPSSDWDSDTIPDQYELFKYHTDPSDDDTNDNGYLDNVEISLGQNSLNDEFVFIEGEDMFEEDHTIIDDSAASNGKGLMIESDDGPINFELDLSQVNYLYQFHVRYRSNEKGKLSVIIGNSDLDIVANTYDISKGGYDCLSTEMFQVVDGNDPVKFYLDTQGDILNSEVVIDRVVITKHDLNYHDTFKPLIDPSVKDWDNDQILDYHEYQMAGYRFRSEDLYDSEYWDDKYFNMEELNPDPSATGEDKWITKRVPVVTNVTKPDAIDDHCLKLSLGIDYQDVEIDGEIHTVPGNDFHTIDQLVDNDNLPSSFPLADYYQIMVRASSPTLNDRLPQATMKMRLFDDGSGNILKPVKDTQNNGEYVIESFELTNDFNWYISSFYEVVGDPLQDVNFNVGLSFSTSNGDVSTVFVDDILIVPRSASDSYWNSIPNDPTIYDLDLDGITDSIENHEKIAYIEFESWYYDNPPNPPSSPVSELESDPLALNSQSVEVKLTDQNLLEVPMGSISLDKYIDTTIPDLDYILLVRVGAYNDPDPAQGIPVPVMKVQSGGFSFSKSIGTARYNWIYVGEFNLLNDPTFLSALSIKQVGTGGAPSNQLLFDSLAIVLKEEYPNHPTSSYQYDTDRDMYSDGLEYCKNVWWYDLENTGQPGLRPPAGHSINGYEIDDMFSNGEGVQIGTTSVNIENAGIFEPGKYSIAIRGISENPEQHVDVDFLGVEEGGGFEILAQDQIADIGTAMPQVSYIPIEFDFPAYGDGTPVFERTGVNIQLPTLDQEIVIDNYAMIRTRDHTGKRTDAVFGQMTDPLNWDTNYNKLPDGKDISKNIYWGEGEMYTDYIAQSIACSYCSLCNYLTIPLSYEKTFDIDIPSGKYRLAISMENEVSGGGGSIVDVKVFDSASNPILITNGDDQYQSIWIDDKMNSYFTDTFIVNEDQTVEFSVCSDKIIHLDRFFFIRVEEVPLLSNWEGTPTDANFYFTPPNYKLNGMGEYTPLTMCDPFVDDGDRDGVLDREELLITGGRVGIDFKSSPLFADIDGDQLNDYAEKNYGAMLNPNTADSDRDMIPDGWVDGWAWDPEIRGFIKINEIDGDIDGVEDDLGTKVYYTEENGFSKYYSSGARELILMEGEGIDGREKLYSITNNYFTEQDISGDCNNPNPQYFIKNMPLPDSSDTDGDGLKDWMEIVKGTDPTDFDTDNDGLGDLSEGRYRQFQLPTSSRKEYYTTDPLDSDTDNDGLTDGLESGLSWGADPSSSEVKAYRKLDHKIKVGGVLSDVYVYSTAKESEDGWNYMDIKHYSSEQGFVSDADPNSKTNPGNPDTDRDGIPDGIIDNWIFLYEDIRSDWNFYSRTTPMDPYNYNQDGGDPDGDSANEIAFYEPCEGNWEAWGNPNGIEYSSVNEVTRTFTVDTFNGGWALNSVEFHNPEANPIVYPTGEDEYFGSGQYYGEGNDFHYKLTVEDFSDTDYTKLSSKQLTSGSLDLSDFNFLGLWVRPSIDFKEGELKLVIKDYSSSVSKTLEFPALENAISHKVTWNISDSDLDDVKYMEIWIKSNDGSSLSFEIDLDEMIVTDSEAGFIDTERSCAIINYNFEITDTSFTPLEDVFLGKVDYSANPIDLRDEEDNDPSLLSLWIKSTEDLGVNNVHLKLYKTTTITSTTTPVIDIIIPSVDVTRRHFFIDLPDDTNGIYQDLRTMTLFIENLQPHNMSIEIDDIIFYHDEAWVWENCLPEFDYWEPGIWMPYEPILEDKGVKSSIFPIYKIQSTVNSGSFYYRDYLDPNIIDVWEGEDRDLDGKVDGWDGSEPEEGAEWEMWASTPSKYIETDPSNPDTDGGGISDGFEIIFYFIGWDGENDPYDHTTQLNPIKSSGASGDLEVNLSWVDSDNDDLANILESKVYHTNPLDSDTDDDWLSDGLEVNTYKTDPLVFDTDQDFLPDGVEVNDDRPTDPLDIDSDNDGLPDGWVDGWGYIPFEEGDPDSAKGWGPYYTLDYIHSLQVKEETSSLSDEEEDILYNMIKKMEFDIDGIQQPWEGEDFNMDGSTEDSGAWEYVIDPKDKVYSYLDPLIEVSPEKLGDWQHPYILDSDGDGFSDYTEDLANTNESDWSDYPENTGAYHQIVPVVNVPLYDNEGNNIGWKPLANYWHIGLETDPTDDYTFTGYDGKYSGLSDSQWIYRLLILKDRDMEQYVPLDITDRTDFDNDGVPNWIEQEIGTDMYNEDSDNDNLTDYIEISYMDEIWENWNPDAPDWDSAVEDYFQYPDPPAIEDWDPYRVNGVSLHYDPQLDMNPNDPDTDDDGLPDWWEYKYNSILREDFPGRSMDTGRFEWLYWLNPTRMCVIPDDENGVDPWIQEDYLGKTCTQLSDGTYIVVPNFASDEWSNNNEYGIGSDPCRLDTDGDGLYDGPEERQIGTGASLTTDFDSDGLNDFEEYHIFPTYPWDPNSDDDELNDGLEILNEYYSQVMKYDPNIKCTYGGLIDSADSDGDGIVDTFDLSPNSQFGNVPEWCKYFDWSDEYNAGMYIRRMPMTGWGVDAVEHKKGDLLNPYPHNTVDTAVRESRFTDDRIRYEMEMTISNSLKTSSSVAGPNIDVVHYKEDGDSETGDLVRRNGRTLTDPPIYHVIDYDYKCQEYEVIYRNEWPYGFKERDANEDPFDISSHGGKVPTIEVKELGSNMKVIIQISIPASEDMNYKNEIDLDYYEAAMKYSIYPLVNKKFSELDSAIQDSPFSGHFYSDGNTSSGPVSYKDDCLFNSYNIGEVDCEYNHYNTIKKAKFMGTNGDGSPNHRFSYQFELEIPPNYTQEDRLIEDDGKYYLPFLISPIWIRHGWNFDTGEYELSFIKMETDNLVFGSFLSQYNQWGWSAYSKVSKYGDGKIKNDLRFIEIAANEIFTDQDSYEIATYGEVDDYYVSYMDEFDTQHVRYLDLFVFKPGTDLPTSFDIDDYDGLITVYKTDITKSTIEEYLSLNDNDHWSFYMDGQVLDDEDYEENQDKYPKSYCDSSHMDYKRVDYTPIIEYYEEPQGGLTKVGNSYPHLHFSSEGFGEAKTLSGHGLEDTGDSLVLTNELNSQERCLDMATQDKEDLEIAEGLDLRHLDYKFKDSNKPAIAEEYLGIKLSITNLNQASLENSKFLKIGKGKYLAVEYEFSSDKSGKAFVNYQKQCKPYADSNKIEVDQDASENQIYYYMAEFSNIDVASIKSFVALASYGYGAIKLFGQGFELIGMYQEGANKWVVLRKTLEFVDGCVSFGKGTFELLQKLQYTTKTMSKVTQVAFAIVTLVITIVIFVITILACLEMLREASNNWEETYAEWNLIASITSGVFDIIMGILGVIALILVLCAVAFAPIVVLILAVVAVLILLYVAVAKLVCWLFGVDDYYANIICNPAYLIGWSIAEHFSSDIDPKFCIDTYNAALEKITSIIQDNTTHPNPFFIRPQELPGT